MVAPIHVAESKASGASHLVAGLGNRRADVFPTWPANFPLLGIPLDHCLVTSGICVARKRIGPNLGFQPQTFAMRK